MADVAEINGLGADANWLSDRQRRTRNSTP